jgi:chromatin segregation and condensation protein Rec8/ScpA/Scc1 (kleisin family)
MEKLNIRLDAFEGPIELLYHLIEKHEIDIYDIPIASLTEQYLAYLDAAEDKDMEDMSEFLLMAATLLEIKSKLLLPSPKQDAEEAAADPRTELVQKLLEYKKIKDVTGELKQKEEEAAQRFYKKADASVKKLKQAPPDKLDEILLKTDVLSLSVALTDETRYLMDRRRLGLLHHSAVVVNESRGKVLDETALRELLEADKLCGAVLDVFEEEPLPEDSILWNLPNVVLTPHNSFIGDGDANRLATLILQNLETLH